MGNSPNSRRAPKASTPIYRRHEGITGLDVAWPCRCNCALIRTAPHSKVSDILVWKCAHCGARKGKVTDDEIHSLASFTDRRGWNQQPLKWCESFGGFF